MNFNAFKLVLFLFFISKFSFTANPDCPTDVSIIIVDLATSEDYQQKLNEKSLALVDKYNCALMYLVRIRRMHLNGLDLRKILQIQNWMMSILHFEQLASTISLDKYWQFFLEDQKTSSLLDIFSPFVADPRVNLNFKYNGEAFVHQVVRADNPAYLALLLANKNMVINLRNNNGHTPLHLALFCHKDESVKLLLDRKDIDINMCDDSGNTAVHLAVNTDSNASLKLLIQKGAHVNCLNNQKFTALHEAMHRFYDIRNNEDVQNLKETIDILLSSDDIDVNIEGGHFKETAFMKAARYSTIKSFNEENAPCYGAVVFEFIKSHPKFANCVSRDITGQTAYIQNQ